MRYVIDGIRKCPHPPAFAGAGSEVPPLRDANLRWLLRTKRGLEELALAKAGDAQHSSSPYAFLPSLHEHSSRDLFASLADEANSG
jgi:hypothetical protein